MSNKKTVIGCFVGAGFLVGASWISPLGQSFLEAWQQSAPPSSSIEVITLLSPEHCLCLGADEGEEVAFNAICSAER